MAGVFCLGIATLDYVYGVERVPQPGEKDRARDLVVTGGGCAGSASAAIGRLGGKAWLATRLGDDITGDAIRAELHRDGVDTSLAACFPGLRSPVSAILIDAQGERMVVSYTDPATPLTTDWLPAALPQGADAVLVDTRWGEGSLAALKLARAAGVPGVIDGDRQPTHPEMVTVASHVAFSEKALSEISGGADPHAAIAAMAQGAQNWLAVTLGHRGVLFMENGGIAHMPAFEVEVVDTLGAGDVWHGAFALAIAEGQSERAAVRFASAVAAIKCTRFGGRAGTPDRAEVERFLADHP
ncbi:PfkB family carbohydrate kinase [Bosea sp. TWI1241]|uniref:PfkB family carbohydrate kinase n=1 Tax=Bosea sp. TWI1241 TaxID=3148904 RepID=UPI003209ACF7